MAESSPSKAANPHLISLRDRNEELRDKLIAKAALMLDQYEDAQKELKATQTREEELTKLNEAYRKMCASIVEQMQRQKVAHEEEVVSLEEQIAALKQQVNELRKECEALRSENQRSHRSSALTPSANSQHSVLEKSSIKQLSMSTPSVAGSLFQFSSARILSELLQMDSVRLEHQFRAQSSAQMEAPGRRTKNHVQDHLATAPQIFGTDLVLDEESRLLLSASFNEAPFVESFMYGTSSPAKRSRQGLTLPTLKHSR
jgi:DNA repair exonuclease SbcCD ATPase subunit